MERRSNSRRTPVTRAKKSVKRNTQPGWWLGAVFQFFGSGKDLWRDEDPDEYVRRLREGWD